MGNFIHSNTVIEQLNQFRLRDKFSPAAWEERGLMPSAFELCQKLTFFFDTMADKLINGIKQEYSQEELLAIFNSQLNSLKQADYDTEEREFICDLFFQLGSIIDIDIRDTLSEWMYGPLLTKLMKLKKEKNPEKILGTAEGHCRQCNTPFLVLITKKEDGIEETSWLTVKCDVCGTLNLILHGQDVKEMKLVNCQWINDINIDKEYSYEQALEILNGIKT